MTSPIESDAGAGPEPDAPSTLARLHVFAMRHHNRKEALLSLGDGKWQPTPDWRFDRQALRIALYLREKVSLGPGERIAVVSPLRREWVIVDFAAAVQGACAVAIDPALPDAALAAALTQLSPRVLFVSDPETLERVWAVKNGAPEPRLVVSFDGPSVPGRSVVWVEALDLGGTLDTPERAQALRAYAREVPPAAEALGQVVLADGAISLAFVRHGEAATRIRARWSRAPAQDGDLAYVAGGTATLAARLAIYSFVGDGRTTTAIGTVGRERAEIAELRPHEIVAPGATLEAAMDAVAVPPSTPETLRQRIFSRLARRIVKKQPRPGVFGGRARWVQPLGDVSGTALQSLREVVQVERGG